MTRNTTVQGFNGKKWVYTNGLVGHWKIDSAIKWGRARGIVGEMIIEHTVFDFSGKGRGGHDGRWEVDKHNNTSQIELWEEGEHIEYPV
tara:strand:+ start:322 stop:588 length:267 start_codon:yes stop_codon:yes gene_type:complete